MKITVKINSRGRPNELIGTVNRWSMMADNLNNVEFIVSLDKDDLPMQDPLVLGQLGKIPNCRFFFGDSKTKVQSVNADIQHATGEILFQIADDIVCVKTGWDKKIIEDMNEFFPDLDGVLHYPDGIQDRRICTHPVMGKKYYNRFGYLSNPNYLGLFGDNELTEVAKHLKKIRYIPFIFFKHDHPLLGNRKADANNERDAKNSDIDHQTYLTRKGKGFDGIIASQDPNARPNVVIAICSNGTWRAKMAGNLCGLILQSAYGYRNKFVISGVIEEQSSVISGARNHAVQQALGIKGATHILFIDTDATFPVTTLDRLLEHNADVIGCNALRRSAPYTPTGEKLENGKWILGCHLMLVKLSVFKAFSFPWFNGHYLPDGMYRGEDQDFCDKVNEFSSVQCDEELSMEVGHLGEMSFILEMHNNINDLKS